MSAYTDRLRQIAQEEGMNVDEVMRVVGSEGGFNDPYIRSKGVQNGVQEYSLGPLQLNMRRGVGVLAKAAGFDASKDWEGAYRYGLRHAKKYGWGDWEGAKKLGLVKASAGDGKPRLFHRGGAGSKPENFRYDGPATVAGDTTGGAAGGGGGQYQLPPKEQPKKTKGEKLGDAIKGLGEDLNKDLGMGSAPGIEAAQFSGGEGMPSVMRPQFQPVQAPMPSGGGMDLRALLAQLMGGRGGNV